MEKDTSRINNHKRAGTAILIEKKTRLKDNITTDRGTFYNGKG